MRSLGFSFRKKNNLDTNDSENSSSIDNIYASTLADEVENISAATIIRHALYYLFIQVD